VHTLLDLRGNIPTFIHISEVKLHEVNVFDEIIPEPGAFYAVDCGYLEFDCLYRFHAEEAFFFLRNKSNVLLRRRYSRSVDDGCGVLCDQTAVLYTANSASHYPDVLCRVHFRDSDTAQCLEFLTDNFVLPPLTVARIYKCRGQVKLFFKWIERHLQIKALYGTNENAIKTLIWIAVSV
jgi:IS4 transposase